MCNDHSNVLVEVTVPEWLSYTGEERRAKKGIDGCIAPLVEALNAVGLTTIASCCGHGHRPGNIALADGREIIIARDFAEARKIDALFPITSYGKVRSHDKEQAHG